ncbi:hypothetical protein DFH06DRAFT_1325990 [Mycena polygramma]|nr:hypothetical protein DFH06DRAFT_1325990 [Mycena polygramma]
MPPTLRSAKSSTFYSLLRGLPLELISLVMVFAVLGNRYPLQIARTRSSLCLSSKFLATVIYNIAPVWDHLILECDSRITVESVRALLNNSAGRSLSLSVRIWRIGRPGVVRPDKIRNFIYTFFDILDVHFHRFRSVDIICFDRDGSELMLAYLTRFDCRHIDNMTMTLCLTPDPDADIRRGPFASSFPLLRAISIRRSFLPSCFQALGATVTDLRLAMIKEIDRVTWEDARDMLSSFPNLTRLELSGVPCAFFPNTPPPKIRFDYLTHLCVMVGSKSMMDVVQTLSAPALTHLHLATLNRLAVANFISSCSALLRLPQHVRLNFAGNFRSAEIAVAIDSLRSATELDLSQNRHRTPSRLVEATKLINIQKLEKIYLPHNFGDDEVVEAFVNQRLHGCSLITKVEIEGKELYRTSRISEGTINRVEAEAARQDVWKF